MKECEGILEDDEESEHGLQYGDWLPASPLCRIKRTPN